MPNEANPSMQLRAIEGEIAKFDDVGWDLPFTKSLLTIAKELERERDGVVKSATDQHLALADRASQELQTLRTENATLKRRLDEAMKERDEADEHHRRYVNANLEGRKMILGEIDMLRIQNRQLKANSVQECGKRGGLKGGLARAEKLSPERRKEIARMGPEARKKKAKASPPPHHRD